MKQNELVEKVPFIFHLTDKKNFHFIVKTKTIYSTNELIDMSLIKDKDDFKTTRRKEHEALEVKGMKVWIRDQRPLNAALDKCLTHGWTRGQFINSLNSRVFFWPNLYRLNTHFDRYRNENPVIIKIDILKALELNPNVQLSHLNSGATRPLASLGGKAPERGPNTFLPVSEYDKGLQKLAEITFPSHFTLPDSFFVSEDPIGPWGKFDINAF